MSEWEATVYALALIGVIGFWLAKETPKLADTLGGLIGWFIAIVFTVWTIGVGALIIYTILT